MKILYNNQITTETTITPSNENYDYPFSDNLLDTRLTRYGRFTGCTSEYLIFNNPAGISFTDVLIANSNLTIDAVVKFQANIINDFTSPPIDVTLTRLSNGYYYASLTSDTPEINFLVDESSNFLVDESGNFYVDFDGTDYLYCRLLFADSTNPDGYIKISKIFIGDALIMPGIDPACELQTTTNSIVTENMSGQIFQDRRTQIKSGKFSFPVITEIQRKELGTFFETVDITDPFFLLIWESSLDIEPPLYTRLLSNLEVKKLSNLLFTLNFEFREVK